MKNNKKLIQKGTIRKEKGLFVAKNDKNIELFSHVSLEIVKKQIYIKCFRQHPDLPFTVIFKKIDRIIHFTLCPVSKYVDLKKGK